MDFLAIVHMRRIAKANEKVGQRYTLKLFFFFRVLYLTMLAERRYEATRPSFMQNNT